MILKPSFALKLNSKGFSPIHLALQNNHKELVHRLVDINKDLVRVKGREGVTPLHFVSEKGEIDLLTKFLSACPDSIEDVTVRSETALHVAVENKRLDALKVLVHWLERNTREGAVRLEHSILDWKDEAGNTILHLSALDDDILALELMINSGLMNLNAKNSENSTALDKATCDDIKGKLLKAGALRGSSVEDDPTPADQLRSKTTCCQKTINVIERIKGSISDKKREAYLVAAALLLTGIYQTALSPPGGFYQADNGANNLNTTSSLNCTPNATAENAGISILSAYEFNILSFINTMVLLSTTMTILILIPIGRVGGQLMAQTICYAVSYLYSVQLISPTRGVPFLVSHVVLPLVLNYYWMLIY